MSAKKDREAVEGLVALPRLLLVQEVASRLRLSRAAVYLLIKGGQLPVVRFQAGGGTVKDSGRAPERWTYRVDQDDLARFIAERRTPTRVGK